MRKLRILLIAPEPFGEPRGTPINVLEMCRVLAAAGHEVDLVTYPLGRPVTVDGVRVHRGIRPPGVRRVGIGFSARKVILDAFLAPQVWWRIARGGYDVVHAVEESIFLALPAARLRGTRVIYDLDSSISEQLEYAGVLRSRRMLRLVRHAEALALARCDLAITVSRSLSRFARELNESIPIVQIEDAPLAGTSRPPLPEAVADLRRRLGVGDAPCFVYTGNLESYQGLDVLVAAIPLVLARRPDARFVIVGGDAPRLDRLRRRAERDGFAASLVLAGAHPAEEMPAFMALATALVSPRSGGHNTPLKIYTYMQAGRPIVASDRETHRQVLDETTAVLVPATPEGFAGGLLRVLADPAAADSLGQAARRRVESRYTAERFAAKLLRAYASVAGQAPLPPGTVLADTPEQGDGTNGAGDLEPSSSGLGRASQTRESRTA